MRFAASRSELEVFSRRGCFSSVTPLACCLTWANISTDWHDWNFAAWRHSPQLLPEFGSRSFTFLVGFELLWYFLESEVSHDTSPSANSVRVCAAAYVKAEHWREREREKAMFACWSVTVLFRSLRILWEFCGNSVGNPRGRGLDRYRCYAVVLTKLSYL